MNILILGASGLIGSTIYRQLQQDANVYGTYCSHQPEVSHNNMFEFKVTDSAQLDKILNLSNPDIVISCLRGDFSCQMQRHKEVANYLEKKNGRLLFVK